MDDLVLVGPRTHRAQVDDLLSALSEQPSGTCASSAGVTIDDDSIALHLVETIAELTNGYVQRTFDVTARELTGRAHINEQNALLHPLLSLCGRTDLDRLGSVGLSATEPQDSARYKFFHHVHQRYDRTSARATQIPPT